MTGRRPEEWKGKEGEINEAEKNERGKEEGNKIEIAKGERRADKK
jgi:hypothetical protein